MLSRIIQTFQATLLLVLTLAVTANAVLINNSDGTVTQNRNDGSSLMWLKDASTSLTSGYDADGLMVWSEAITWIDSLNSSDYLGYNDWRLPSALNSDGSGPCIGSNCTNSEMGYMYYTELGNSVWGPLGNTGIFDNLQASYYWSGTTWVLDPTAAFDFNFGDGQQDAYDKGFEDNVWAVRDIIVVPGSGGIVVPEPGSLLLIGSGLIGLFVLKRLKK